MEEKKIIKAVGGMGLATMLSRVLGYWRDALAAGLFGAGPVSDAFVAAFRLPNMFRDLFAEGALSSAFVPAFARAKHHSEGEAWRLAALMLNAVVLLMALLVALGVWFAPQIVGLAAPGFRADPIQFQLTIRLTRILFPFIAFMALAALLMGMLNSRKRFGIPALAPAMMNVVMISFGLFVCPRIEGGPPAQIIGWAWGALLGGAAQMFFQWPAAWNQGFRPILAWPFKDAGVRKVLGQMGPAVLGNSTTQINLVINTILASQLGAGALTYLYYGNRLMQLPLGVFGVAIATAVLPDLALHRASGDPVAFRKLLGYGLRLTLFITLPAMAGLILLAEPINLLLLRWGHFDAQAAHATAMASICYTLGVVFASWTKVLVPSFYAIDEPGVPVKVSLICVAINLALNLALMGSLGYLGLALAASVSAAIQALLLQWLLRRRVGVLWDKAGLRDGARMIMAVFAMVLTLLVAEAGLASLGMDVTDLSMGRAVLAAKVFGLIALGAVVYALVASALGLAYVDLRRLRLSARVGSGQLANPEHED